MERPSIILHGTDETTIKLLTGQIAWFKDWICAATRPLSDASIWQPRS